MPEIALKITNGEFHFNCNAFGYNFAGTRRLFPQITVLKPHIPAAIDKINRRNKLIEEHYCLVNKVVNFMSFRFNGIINRDDMVDFATAGLMDAAEKFNPDKNVAFKNYAITRIKGAILDGARKLDYMSRNVRGLSNKIEGIYEKLEQKLNRMPSGSEMADELGISVNKFNKILYQIRGSAFLADKDFLFSGNEEYETLDTILSKEKSPIDKLLSAERENILKSHIEKLERIEKTVILLYYYNDLTLVEIGKKLNLTESRICQLHGQAVRKLRLWLSNMEAAW